MADSEDISIYKADFGNMGDTTLLAQLLENGRLSDVEIRVGDRSFFANKFWLAYTIPYFKAMFLSDMRESQQPCVEIQSVDVETMDALLKFVYTGRLCISGDNVQSLLLGASFLQMEQVKLKCCSFIKKNLCVSNCVAVKLLAEQLGLSHLLEYASEFVLRHFRDIVQLEEFATSTSKDDLIALIKSDRLHVKREEEVFDAVLRWIRCDEGSRRQYLAEILGHVRLPLMPPHVLTDKVGANPLVRRCLECRDLLDEAKDYYLLPERRSAPGALKAKPRYSFHCFGTVFVVGGLDMLGESVDAVEFYDNDASKWEKTTPLNQKRSRLGLCCYDGQVYALGGFDGQNRLKSCEVFEQTHQSWSNMAEMRWARSASSCETVMHKIFVCGGYDGQNSLNNVEMYDPVHHIWADHVSNMHRNRSAAAAAVLSDEKLFVLGGHDGLSIFQSIETYDPALDVWTQDYVANMRSKRCRLGVAVFMGSIYACGGYDSANFLNTMEMLDPRKGTWNQVASMTYKRSRVSLVASYGVLFAIGGYDGSLNLRSVEVYDPRADRWVDGTPMIAHEGGVGACVVPKCTVELVQVFRTPSVPLKDLWRGCCELQLAAFHYKDRLLFLRKWPALNQPASFHMTESSFPFREVPVVVTMDLPAYQEEMINFGSLTGFKYLHFQIRGKEELLIFVQNDRNPAPIVSPPSSEYLLQSPRDSEPERFKNTLPYERRWLLMSLNTQQSLIDHQGLDDEDLTPASPCGKETSQLPECTMFLLAAYARYKSPHVWIRSHHERLVRIGSEFDRDSPLRLPSTDNFTSEPSTSHVWNTLIDLVRLCTRPRPTNPLAVDLNYFRSISNHHRRKLSLSHIIHCLETVYVEPAAISSWLFRTAVQTDLFQLKQLYYEN